MSNNLPLGVLISGSGTNLQAIIEAIDSGTLDAEITVVISSHEGAHGLVRAHHHGIHAVHVDRGAYDSARAYNIAIRDALREHYVDVVVMAGYMRLLGKDVLDAYPNRVSTSIPPCCRVSLGPAASRTPSITA